ncbi:MAG: hypothetical protein AAGK32_04875, partial [Actinomycetota bacterium]
RVGQSVERGLETASIAVEEPHDALFSQTGGVTGGEVAIAGGTAAAGNAVLSAVFGDQAVRDLVLQAQELLEQRVVGLFDSDRRRLEATLDRLPDAAAAGDVRRAAADLPPLP